MKKPFNIVIMGRPNVGKSTLFNRLYGSKRALVHDLPGVTRDRLECETTWWIRAQPLEVKLVDTGGLGEGTFSEEISRQVVIALSEADLVLVVFDGRSGLLFEDEAVARQVVRSGLSQKGVPVIGVVNKIDDTQHEERMNDFYQLGLEEWAAISAEHNRGIESLREQVASLLGMQLNEGKTELDVSTLETPSLEEESSEYQVEFDSEKEEPLPTDQRIKVAVVGRPNVGKSTLINALLRESRMITSPIAGTTVDSVDSEVEIDGVKILLIDTAGIRRKSKTEKGVEVLSVLQTRKALERADVALLVLDAETGVTDQDEKIGGMIEEVGCSVALILNKWDVHKQNPKFTKDSAAEIIKSKMAFLRYAPIIFTSAKEKRGFNHLGELIQDMITQKSFKISTKEFTEWVRDESKIHNPHNAKFYLAHQVSRHPPTFRCHVSDPKKVHFSLQRHLVNAMRARWGFMGSPIRMNFEKGRNASR